VLDTIGKKTYDALAEEDQVLAVSSTPENLPTLSQVISSILYFIYYILSFYLFGSQKLDNIEIYTEMFECKIKSVLYKISVTKSIWQKKFCQRLVR